MNKQEQEVRKERKKKRRSEKKNGLKRVNALFR